MIKTKSLQQIINYGKSSFTSDSKVSQLVLCLLPALLLIWFIVNFGVNVPYLDQWGLPQFFQKVAAGEVGIKDVAAQHNEHRIAFPRIIFSTLAFASQWNIMWEMFASLFLAIITFLILYQLARKTVKPSSRLWILKKLPIFLTATLVFSLHQYENWLWGFQLAWFLVNLCLIISIYILYQSRKSKSKYVWIAAALPCFVASFSLAHGILTWVATIPSVLAFEKNNTKSLSKRLLVWAVLFTGSLWLYLIGYTRPTHHPSSSFTISNPFVGINYFLSLLGSSLAQDDKVSFWVGFSLVACFALLIYYFFKLSRDSIISISPWLSMGLYSLLFAGMTTVGRAGFGVEQAMSPRYRTVTIFFVVSVLQLGAIALSGSRIKPGSGGLITIRPKAKFLRAFKTLLGVIILSFFVNSLSAINAAGPYFKAQRETAKFCLQLIEYMEDIQSNSCNALLFPSLDFVQDRVFQLETLGFRQVEFERNLDFLKYAPTTGAWGNIDVLGPQDPSEPVTHGSSIPIAGWAAYLDRGTVPPYVMFSYNDQRSFFNLVPVNVERPDVAQFYENDEYLRSGWQANLSSEG